MAILSALEIARDEAFDTSNAPITIFIDSQKAIREIQHPASHKNRFLRGQIYHQTTVLQSTGHHIICQRAPGHSRLEGNKKADLTAKNKLNAGVHLLT